MSKGVLVAGAGGFIGGHLVKHLLDRGKEVIAADIKPMDEWWQWHISNPDKGHIVNNSANMDESVRKNAYKSTQLVNEVYNLAADMGGMGFIANHKAECMLSVLINTHLLQAATDQQIDKYLYASSACIYPSYRQDDVDLTALKEEYAYPADPEDGYGWEKLFSERMTHHFYEDFGLDVRLPRLHNVYGPHGSWDGGREKAPAAICRKVATAKINGDYEIEIWGDGEQTRSFMYIDDCLEGFDRLMESNHKEPINLGSNELVSINQLVDIIEGIAGVSMRRTYDMDAPQGVRGRNSDNENINKVLGWEPKTPLADGLEKTYAWIYDQVYREIG